MSIVWIHIQRLIVAARQCDDDAKSLIGFNPSGATCADLIYLLQDRTGPLKWIKAFSYLISLFGEVKQTLIVDFEVPRLLLFKSTAKFDQFVFLISEFWRFWKACLQAISVDSFAFELLFEWLPCYASRVHPAQIVALARLKSLVELFAVVRVALSFYDFDASIAAQVLFFELSLCYLFIYCCWLQYLWPVGSGAIVGLGLNILLRSLDIRGSTLLYNSCCLSTWLLLPLLGNRFLSHHLLIVMTFSSKFKL